MFRHPPPGQIDRVESIIDGLLDDPRTAKAVVAYYDPTQPFAGHTFLDLTPNQPNVVGTADLLAVTLLDVGIKPRAVRELLPDGALARRVSARLMRVPTGMPIWEATDDVMNSADAVWSLLVEEAHGIGPTKAGKLLARKRKDLVPVVDQVVIGMLQCAEDSYWATFRSVLQSVSRRARIDGLLPGMPTLRLLDTVIWMHGSGSKNARTVMATSPAGH
jgi:hypothetical protein